MSAELDTALCQALGIDPAEIWVVRNPGHAFGPGRMRYGGTSTKAARIYAGDGYHLELVYPCVSTDDVAAVSVLWPRLAERFDLVQVSSAMDGCDAEIYMFGNVEDGERSVTEFNGDGAGFAEALANVAEKALAGAEKGAEDEAETE